jgi:hypothetical protein
MDAVSDNMVVVELYKMMMDEEVNLKVLNEQNENYLNKIKKINS